MEPPKSKYQSTLTTLEFVKKGGLDQNLKKDTGKPPKHLYQHTVQVRWHPDGGLLGKEQFAKKKDPAASLPEPGEPVGSRFPGSSPPARLEATRGRTAALWAASRVMALELRGVGTARQLTFVPLQNSDKPPRTPSPWREWADDSATLPACLSWPRLAPPQAAPPPKGRRVRCWRPPSPRPRATPLGSATA
eukprot:CAMPEP_0170304366 /NCGR_PEP_ID=MMETSP0116_2-20130129/52525_1 /TAXON_ID=400756 /ORGANISM="Durinskia baltica, Strain CSIRO CS-38" /LENGTH=190 /DNA_ID=CAMNT_0010556353 /DNA_START=24 /DNA_END=597 /DNA_ORIENTATION=+